MVSTSIVSLARLCCGLALLAGGGGIALATDPPPQLRSVFAPTASLYYAELQTFRMANGVSGDYTGRLCISVLYGDPLVEQLRYGAYFDSGGFHVLPRWDANTTVAEATSGTFSDYFAGRMDGDDATTYVPPQWWNNGNSTKDQVRWGNNQRSGQWWDVISDGTTNWHAGFFIDGSSVSQPFWWRSSDSVDSPTLFPLGGFDGGEAKCLSIGLSSVMYAGGRVIDGTDNIPCIWTFSGSWSFTNVTSSSDWPSGRTGWIVGTTNKVSGDNAGPYAVGWMEPSGGNPGQAFIYSIGNGEIRFVSGDYGEPLQVSNKGHTSGEPEVSFVGFSTTSSQPYIWIGSPDKDSAWTGVANPIWSFTDGDVQEFKGLTPTVATGINSAFHFGGDGFPLSDIDDVGSQGWVSTSSSWDMATNAVATLDTGSDASGSTRTAVHLVDGKFARVNNGISAGGVDPEIKVRIDAVVDTGAQEIAFRTTAKTGTSPATEWKIDIRNWSTGQWENVYTAAGVSWWRTKLVKITSNLGNYIDGSGNVRARMTIRKTGPFLGATWSADFEQLVWMWN